MPKYNELIINGRSTGDLPFFCGVEENSAPTRAEKKNKYYDLEMANGVAIQTVEAWKAVTKAYRFYLHEATKNDVRKLKAFIGYTGWFTPSDDPDIRYIFVNALFDSEPLDEFNGYTVTVTFTCEPFEYESETTGVLGNSIVNHTNAPMYPKLTLTGNANSSLFVQIGNQKMTFTKGIMGTVTVECKHGLQDVQTGAGKSINSQVRGPFFEVVPGEHAVSKSPGITNIQILNRWGWS
ncbi:hypothetical protein LZ578_08595 [Jeotgalibaca sp. MA1X17-3]|uniref:hypothetical protein n=1 Tax=Jeotgalibaca sp. MA1X17-3 TaxID=2908211 RepID=UPI001F39386C|nr:hypothetical protein [Jeotgalibaca sp. MA1X17-3]UJF15057.1 hypothetical protein LZ578_08595 [Jeotgalibaca sp. MA1X17-3]